MKEGVRSFRTRTYSNVLLPLDRKRICVAREAKAEVWQNPDASTWLGRNDVPLSNYDDRFSSNLFI